MLQLLRKISPWMAVVLFVAGLLFTFAGSQIGLGPPYIGDTFALIGIISCMAIIFVALAHFHAFATYWLRKLL
jgi:hypothetical protein